MSTNKFFLMLDKAPRLVNLWDREKRELKLDLFEGALGVMSRSEVHLAKFFAAVWFGNNKRFGFDVVDAASSLDAPERDIIINWMKDPFWP